MENQRMSESVVGADDALVDVSVARKLLDESLAVQQVDLPDFFLALYRRTEVDVIADKIATQWAEAGHTPDAMLEVLHEERERCVV